MGKRSRSRDKSRDRKDKDRDHKKDKKRSRSRDRSREKERHKEHRTHHEDERRRSKDRRETRPERDHRDFRDNRETRDTKETREPRGEFFGRSSGGGFGGGWGNTQATSLGTVPSTGGGNNYLDFVKRIADKKKDEDRWTNAPDDLKIKDENGEINEEYLKAVQSNTNMDKQIQRELGERFNEKLRDAKTIVPKIDQTDLENRNRFLGSADPYELQMYGLPIQGQGTMITDKAKLMRKIYIPKNNNFNYTGFIIGPRGSNQKRLEEETKCKILLRGKGSQKEGSSVQLSMADDTDDLHVLVTADNNDDLEKGVKEIEKIIFADEETRNALKKDQLQILAKVRNELGTAPDSAPFDPATGNFGSGSGEVKMIQVPRECIGLVIGRKGETIKNLQAKSGATKIQAAPESSDGSDYRSVYIDGSEEACMTVINLINEIVQNHMKLQKAQQNKITDSNETRYVLMIPSSIIGAVIGKSGETIKYISKKTGAIVFMDKDDDKTGDSLEKKIIITGTRLQAEEAKHEIDFIVKQKHLTLKWWEDRDGLAKAKDVSDSTHYTQGGFSIPGYENLHELQKWMTTENWFNYYENTSTAVTTEYYKDGTVKVIRNSADNNYESMPDIGELMKKYLPAPKSEDAKEEQIFDPNRMNSEDDARRNGGKLFAYQLPGMTLDKQKPSTMYNKTEVMTFQPAFQW